MRFAFLFFGLNRMFFLSQVHSGILFVSVSTKIG